MEISFYGLIFSLHSCQKTAVVTTYAQHGLVNIAKKKRELKSSQINLFERIFDDEIIY